MATTTLQQAQRGAQLVPWRKNYTTAEAAGVLMSSWNIGGTPAAGATPSTGSGSTCDGSTTGSFITMSGDPVLLMSGMYMDAGVACTEMFCDRLWHQSGLTVTTTTEQAINSVTFPARCLDGTSNGLGVMVGIEVTTATTNAGAITTITLNYTNQDGTSGRTGTIPSFPATCTVNSFIPFTLQAGDTGVRSIEGVTLGTSLVTGAINVVAYIPLLLQGIISTARPEPAQLDRALMRMRPDACLFTLDQRNGTTTQVVFGSITVVDG